jgi:hypothetical protein
MNESIINFIAANAVLLAVPGGMPGTFAGKVADDRDAFDEKYNAFMSSRETSTARNAKVSANNDLFDAMTDVNKDGVEMVYRNDDGGKKRYTFTALKVLVSAPGGASLKIGVMRSGSNEHVEGAIVKMQMKGGRVLTGTTDANGEVVFKNIETGVYTGSVDVNDVLTAFTKEVNTGVDARVTVVV